MLLIDSLFWSEVILLLGKDDVSSMHFINSGNTYLMGSGLFSLLSFYFSSGSSYNVLCILSLLTTDYFTLIAILYNGSIKVIVKIKIKKT